MNKQAIAKGLFSSILAATMIFGFLHLTVEPAEAGFQCPPELFGNTFSHIAVTPVGNGTYICCCIYTTSSGEEVTGPSWYC